MNILLTGASGFIGRNIAAVLAQSGHTVKPVSRRDGVDVRQLLTPQDWRPLLDGIDAAINCIGIIGQTRAQRFSVLHTQAPSALFRACALAGVRRVVQISALGADETAFSAYHLSKRAADDCLRSLGNLCANLREPACPDSGWDARRKAHRYPVVSGAFATPQTARSRDALAATDSCRGSPDLDGFVLRPSLVYGRGGDSTRVFMRLARLPLIPVVGDGQYRVQPVHVSDVAAAVLRCLTAPAGGITLDVVGPEPLAFSEWLQRLRQAQGLPRAPLLRAPFPLMLALARLGRVFVPMLDPENLLMLKAGNCADAASLTRFLDRAPIAFTPRLLDADALMEEARP